MDYPPFPKMNLVPLESEYLFDIDESVLKEVEVHRRARIVNTIFSTKKIKTRQNFLH